LVPCLLIIFLLFFPRKWKKQYFFSLALVITPFIALNQQIITGKLLQNAHYHWFFHTPLAIIFLLIIFFSWISEKKWEFVKKISAISIIGLSVYIGIFIQTVSYASMESEALQKQRYGPVMEWLNENAEKEEVVLATEELSRLIVVYTPLNVFYHRAAMYSLTTSNDRLLNTFFSFYRLNGVGEDEAQESFFKERVRVAHSIYGMYYRESTGSYEGIPDEVLQGIVQKYQESFSIPTNEFLDKLWSKYEVKYLVWDQKNDSQWQLDKYSFLKNVAEIGDFIIYQNDY
jgi:hypothetical protein